MCRDVIGQLQPLATWLSDCGYFAFRNIPAVQRPSLAWPGREKMTRTRSGVDGDGVAWGDAVW